MKAIKIRTFVIFALASLAGAALLHTSQSVQRAEEEMAVINAEIEKERDAIRVLNAEWEYLNRPERLEKLASEFLDLVPPGPDAVQDSMMMEAVSLPERQEETPLVEAQPVTFKSQEENAPEVEAPKDVPKPRYKPSALKSKKPSKKFDDLLGELNADEGEGTP